METADVMGADFWTDERPVVLAPPAMADAAKELAVLLNATDWALGAVVFASSGSSGAPKWIVHRRAGLLCSAREVNRHLGAGPGDHWFLALPEFHVGGFGVAARAHAAGCRFSGFGERWDAGRFVAALSACGGTHTSLVPTQVFDLVEAGWRGPEALRAAVVGGGALENTLGRRARALGWPVLQSYGLTEAGSQVATAGLESLEDEFCNAPLPVMPHWETRVGRDGVLELRGPALFDCYVTTDRGGVRREDARVDGWFATTDRVELQGGDLRFLGRSDRVVKVLGELVNLGGLERRLRDAWDGSVECRVLALSDERSGRRLIAVFEGPAPDGMREVIGRLNASLRGYERLSEALVLDRWPRTPLGKVDVKALEERVAAS